MPRINGATCRVVAWMRSCTGGWRCTGRRKAIGFVRRRVGQNLVAHICHLPAAPWLRQGKRPAPTAARIAKPSVGASATSVSAIGTLLTSA